MKRKYKYVNTDEPVSLESLIISGDISDVTFIRIFDSDGSQLAFGHWYDDHILRFTEHTGIAQRTGSAPSYKFIIQD